MRYQRRTPILTFVFIIIGLCCVWGLKHLYYDDKPIVQPKSESTVIETKTQTTVPKLFIYTSESLKADTTPTTETSHDENTKEELSENALISKILLQQRNNLQRCYENHLRSQPDSRGEILVELKLTPHGKASDVRFEKSDFKDPLFSACIESVLKRIQYKNLSGNDFLISIPLQFQ